jgi:hypothetical protein
VRGELESAVTSGGAVEPGPGVLLPDAFARPPISELEIAANLRARGSSAALSKPGASLAANSETMTGTVTVGLVFVESDGSGSDPDVHDWTADSEDDVYDDAAAALSWWSRRADDHSDCWVTFRLEPYFATEDARCRQAREPTLHPSTDFGSAIATVLGNMGYNIGGHLARAAAFDATLRAEHDTDWAFSAFVAANPSGPTQFTDGYAAWAYLGGPYCALLQRSFGWSFDTVFAHESAHAFRACDEYSVAGYGGCSSCAACGDTGVPNGNCDACNADPDACMMRTNAHAVCDFTVAQLGWDRMPCVPAPLPAPQLDAALPAIAAQGEVLDVELRGDAFAAGCGAEFGAGIDVLSVNLVSDTRLVARVHVRVDAAPGARDVRIVGPDGQDDVLPGGFAVRHTPRHYVSAAGTAKFPYDEPWHAGTDLATVLAACSSGDTVLVCGGTYGAITIERTLVVRGGFQPGFTSRDPATWPTIVYGSPGAPAITVSGDDNRSLLDGLVVRGGSGMLIAPPELGVVTAGGGVLATRGALVLRDCTLEDNGIAGGGAAAGGGAFFWGGTPRLERCIVRRNSATAGAGLVFLDCDARIEACTIESNNIGAGGSGGGLAAFGSRLVIAGGRIADHHGAAQGGGAFFSSCAAIALEGLACVSNTASGDGGGIHATQSALRCVAARFEHNSAGAEGGGAWVQGGAFDLESTLIAANTATAGGAGAHVEAAAGAVVNVTVADNAGGIGMMWMQAPAPVAVKSSIFARNAVVGFLAGGGAPPALDWNLVWQNGAADWVGADPGPHVIAADPRFANAGDYRLALGSPALDGGDPDVARADPDGSRNDCGAHGGPRASPPAPARVSSARVRWTPGGTIVQWTASPAPNLVSYVVYRDSTLAAGVVDRPPLVTVPASQLGVVVADGWDGAAYAVAAVDADGHASSAVLATSTSSPTDAGAPAATLQLHPIAPNPMNPGGWIEFDLPDAQRIRLVVYAADGRRVRALASAAYAAGPHRLYWDGRNDGGRACASGVYWIALDTGRERRTRRAVVVR